MASKKDDWKSSVGFSDRLSVIQSLSVYASKPSAKEEKDAHCSLGHLHIKRLLHLQRLVKHSLTQKDLRAKPTTRQYQEWVSHANSFINLTIHV